MGKWLAAGGIVLVGFLAFLLIQLDSAAETSPPPPPADKVAVAANAMPGSVGVRSAKVALPLPEQKVDDGKPKKLDPQSDAFFFQFDEMVPKQLGMAAAECYHGGLDSKHRNQHLKVSYDNVIKDGVVTVANMKMLPGSNLNDTTMENCMMAKMSAVKWTNEALPDGVWPDTMKISPERGMKKWRKENRDYEGDPTGLPVGKAVMKSANQPAPRSDSATKEGFEAAEAEREQQQ